MDKGSDDIRQDIESTRASLDTKLSMLEDRAQDVVEKTKEAFDVKVQMEQRPWTMLGLSVVAGYVLGTLGGDDGPDYSNRSYSSNTHPSQQDDGPSAMEKVRETGADFMSQFDDEINMLKVAAMTTITGLIRDTVKSAVPALSEQIDKMTSGITGTSTNSSTRLSSSTPTTSPGAALTHRNSTTERGGADYDSIGQMDRYGAPPRNVPSNDATGYYDNASVDPKDMDRKAIDETRTYTQ